MRDYVRPQTLSEVIAHLAQGARRLLAGGTDLYPTAGRKLTGPVLDLTAVDELRGFRAANGLRIGAATTWTEIAEASLPPALNALQQAARQVGGRQIQNAGTIGGNLCNASPAADGVPPLLVVDAEVELVSSLGTRHLPLSKFITGPRKTALAPGEVLTAVTIPEAGLGGRSAFEKLGARTHLVISIAMVAARVRLDGGRIGDIAIAVGSCSGVAVRLAAVEQAVMGARVDQISGLIRPEDVAAALSPIDDVRATATYRIKAAVELVSRTVAEAAR